MVRMLEEEKWEIEIVEFPGRGYRWEIDYSLCSMAVYLETFR